MKNLIVLGDRVLIKQDESEPRTEVGLYLPQTVKDKDEVLQGTIVQTGPGIPLADPSTLGEEPWQQENRHNLRYLPMEAREGDYVLFLRKAAVEVTYEGEKYFIAPQSAILLIIRDEESTPPHEDDLSLDFE